MSTRWGYDEVRGQVIGDITPIWGTLTYGGRPQGQPVSGRSEEEVKAVLVARMKELKEKYAGVCYDTGEKWEVHYAA